MKRVTGKVHGYEDRGGNGDSFVNKCVRHYDEQLWWWLWDHGKENVVLFSF